MAQRLTALQVSSAAAAAWVFFESGGSAVIIAASKHTRRGVLFSPSLTLRTPIRTPRLFPLLPHQDRRPASPAILPRTLVDPQPVGTLHPAGRATLAGVGDDAGALALRHIRL